MIEQLKFAAEFTLKVLFLAVVFNMVSFSVINHIFDAYYKAKANYVERSLQAAARFGKSVNDLPLQ